MSGPVFTFASITVQYSSYTTTIPQFTATISYEKEQSAETAGIPC